MPPGYPSTRPYFNPPQAANYNYDKATEWMKWLKKQSGVDGFRWDAVKHFPTYVQRDLIRGTKYHIDDATWANGNAGMLNIGEWIGGASALDGYVTDVAQASLGDGYEEHTGTFDFNLRGYGSSGGIYSLVLGLGGYNMQSIYGDQQSKRYADYTTPSMRVHRTIPFVNSHDTYRPYLSTNGNFLKGLGDATGWNESNELGGNGKHLDPREPRMAAAYATIFALDGNPMVFFEDIFNVGTTGKRYAHLPTSSTDLPVWNDIDNISKAHQVLGFKDGNYGVPSALADAYVNKGSLANHAVFERTGKAIIGVTDKYNAIANNTDDEEMWVTVDASFIGKFLYDYSGAHGITTSQVFNDRRVLIKTAPVGHTISNARGHGYSIWAPAPAGVTITSVQDLYNVLDTYQQPRSPSTKQEWEMADDLGDSSCLLH